MLFSLFLYILIYPFIFIARVFITFFPILCSLLFPSIVHCFLFISSSILSLHFFFPLAHSLRCPHSLIWPAFSIRCTPLNFWLQSSYTLSAYIPLEIKAFQVYIVFLFRHSLDFFNISNFNLAFHKIGLWSLPQSALHYILECRTEVLNLLSIVIQSNWLVLSPVS